MLKLTVQDIEQDCLTTRYGSDRDLLEFLKRLQPGMLHHVYTLADALRILNDSDLYAARSQPYEPLASANLLPDDYLTASQAESEDPWVRVADRNE